MNINTIVLAVFSVLLMLIGGMAFLMPENIKILSTTYSYNLFRVDLGLLGIIIALSNHKQIIGLSNLIFGVIIAYQPIASTLQLFPIEYFQWTILDDVLNADMGLALILVSLLKKN